MLGLGIESGSSAEQLVLLIAMPSPEPFLDICLQNLAWFGAIWMFLCLRTAFVDETKGLGVWLGRGS